MKNSYLIQDNQYKKDTKSKFRWDGFKIIFCITLINK